MCGSQARIRVKNWVFVYHSSVENSGAILRRKNHSFGANLLVRESGKIPHFPAELSGVPPPGQTRLRFLVRPQAAQAKFEFHKNMMHANSLFSNSP